MDSLPSPVTADSGSQDSSSASESKPPAAQADGALGNPAGSSRPRRGGDSGRKKKDAQTLREKKDAAPPEQNFIEHDGDSYARLCQWPATSKDDRAVRVKVYALAFTILTNYEGNGQTLGELHLTYHYGMHVVKVEQHCPANRIDCPGARCDLREGDRIYARFEVDVRDQIHADSNEDLVLHYSCFFQPVCEDLNDLRRDKRAKLAPDWSRFPRFAACVRDFGLDRKEQKLTWESFDCFRVLYPREAPPAWIGAPEKQFRETSLHKLPEDKKSKEVFAENDIRALNCRYSLDVSAAMIQKQHGGFISPALGQTVVHPGDYVYFMCDGGPGAQSESWIRLDGKWKAAIQKLTDESWLRGRPRVFNDWGLKMERIAVPQPACDDDEDNEQQQDVASGSPSSPGYTIDTSRQHHSPADADRHS
eukprot:TRINITY_DN46778_c0_g1_i3.p1 TRINITY_DN46778_c0_g1~~TRINITY_DN46778_c0_g1_i3.p1  ORF type:complete len:420 (-),score=43.36 TRINITY_DN46778_c0_g1_i3:303-1562(-)